MTGCVGIVAIVTTMSIDRFDKSYYFLSNFFPCKIILDLTFLPWLEHDSFVYHSVEHAYQAAKTPNPFKRAPFAATSLHPGHAKRLGKGLDCRTNWDEVKVDLMRSLLMQKFLNHPELGEQLILTGSEELIEGNYWGDTYWGKCKRRRSEYARKATYGSKRCCEESGMTYTYVIMKVSKAAYKEIKDKLVEAGYDQALHDNTDDDGTPEIVLDMHGIALSEEK